MRGREEINSRVWKMKKSTRRSFLSITDDDPCHRLLAKAFLANKMSSWNAPRGKLIFPSFSHSRAADCHERCTSWVSQNCRKKNSITTLWSIILVLKNGEKCSLSTADCYTHTRQIYMVINRHSPEVHSTWHLMGFDADNSSTAQQSDCFFCTYTQRVTYNKLPTVCGKSSKK